MSEFLLGFCAGSGAVMTGSAVREWARDKSAGDSLSAAAFRIVVGAGLAVLGCAAFALGALYAASAELDGLPWWVAP